MSPSPRRRAGREGRERRPEDRVVAPTATGRGARDANDDTEDRVVAPTRAGRVREGREVPR